MTLLLWTVIDVTVVLAVALAAVAALRRQSAALRHAILATAIVCALCMPALELLLPRLAIIPWHQPVTAVSSGLQMSAADIVPAATVQPPASEDSPIDWAVMVTGIWFTASAVMLVMLLRDLGHLRRLRRRCVPVTDRRRALLDEVAAHMGVRSRVTLLQSEDPALLVTYGTGTPRIIVPSTSATWTDERLRLVLQHELAHITRKDAALYLAGEVLRVLQPFHPLAWLTCRRLRQESEYAADDAVLDAGVAPTTYAGHLLDVARQLSHRHAAWAAVPAIAHPSTLERRIVAMLQKHTNRQPLTRQGWAVATLIALGISLPLAAATVADPVVIDAPQVAPAAAAATSPSPSPVAGPSPAPAAAPMRPVTPAPTRRQPGSVTGQVTDQTGGVIPGATITLTDRQTTAQLQAVTNTAGRFEFTGLAPAEYDLLARLVGFKSVASAITVASGATAMQAIVLPIGELAETITVNCSATSFSLMRALFPVVSAQSSPTPIRVGGQIREPKKIRHVAPPCPADAPQGTHVVHLTATIGVDGLISDAAQAADAPEVPAALLSAGLEAIRQWAFTPTQLNGRATPVTINVTITFTKS